MKRKDQVDEHRKQEQINYRDLSGALDDSWLRAQQSHSELVSRAESHQQTRTVTKRRRRALETVQTPRPTPFFQKWPRRSMGGNVPPPPPITKDLVRAIRDQDHLFEPDDPLPDAAARFVKALAAWREDLAQFFRLSTSDFAANMRAAAGRIERMIAFLPKERRRRVISVITDGYRIPFTATPPPYHRAMNSPDLLQHRNEAWVALKKDIGHGAVVPCDLNQGGKPTVVSPVRTAPKGWRSKKRRFVVRSRDIRAWRVAITTSFILILKNARFIS